MPQMAPISWLSLLMLFSAALIMFNMMNYYSFTTSAPKTQLKKSIIKSLNWKW